MKDPKIWSFFMWFVILLCNVYSKYASENKAVDEDPIG